MARRNSFSQGRRRRGDRRPRRRQRTIRPHGNLPRFPRSGHRPGGCRRNPSARPRRFAPDGHAAKLGRSMLHNWNRTKPLSARPTRRHSATSPTGGRRTALRRNANRSLQNAPQLAAEKELGARRPEAAAAAAGRKSQSIWGFLCAPGAQVPDMSRTFRETDNPVISTGWLVELRGFRTSDLRGAGGRSPEGGATPSSARLNSEGAPPSAPVSPTLCLPPVRPSDLPRRPRRGKDGRLLLCI